MARELVGLKLDVGTHATSGHAKYPDFNLIPAAIGRAWTGLNI